MTKRNNIDRKTKDKSEYYDIFLKDFNSIIDAYAKEINDFFFIQIGANDGMMCDPLNKFINKYKKWRGILVEPQKKEFEKLKKNYKTKKFIFENFAVSNKNGVRKLYKPQKSIIDQDWKRGIASFVPKKKCNVQNNEGGEKYS